MACPFKLLDNEGISYVEVKSDKEIEMLNYIKALGETEGKELPLVWMKNPESLNTYLIYFFCDGKWYKGVVLEEKLRVLEKMKKAL